MRGLSPVRVSILAALVGGAAFAVVGDLAAGGRGLAKDRLDWSGSPTDRYLDGDEVAERLGAGGAQFAACASVEGLGARDEQPYWLEFGIDPQGKAQLTGKQEGGRETELVECLYRALQALDFSEHDGPPGRYSYPVVLSVEDGAVRNTPYPIVLFTEPTLVVPLLTVPPDLSADDLQAIAAELVPSSD